MDKWATAITLFSHAAKPAGRVSPAESILMGPRGGLGGHAKFWIAGREVKCPRPITAGVSDDDDGVVAVGGGG
jgi:hypothetical protein